LILSCAYPAYQLGYSYFMQLKLNKQTKIFVNLHKRTSAIKNELASIKQQRTKVDALFKKENKKFEFRKKLLTQIYAKKISYPMKATLLAQFFEISNKYQSKIDSIDFKDNKFVFNIQNKNDKKITEFIKDLTKLNKYNINTDKIEKVDKKQKYLSKVSIGIIK